MHFLCCLILCKKCQINPGQLQASDSDHSFPARCMKTLQLMKQSSIRGQDSYTSETNKAKLQPSTPLAGIQVKPTQPMKFETLGQKIISIQLSRFMPQGSSTESSLKILECGLQSKLTEPESPPLIFLTRSHQYFVDQHFLKDTQVNELMRACLNNWLIGSVEEHFYTRQTYALTSFYIDSFISRKNTGVTKDNLQLIGYTALLIASKLEETISLGNIPKHMPKEEVLATEKQICLALDFKLNTDTYVHWLNLMMIEWDEFVLENSQYSYVNYQAPNPSSFRRCIQLFEFGDSLNMDTYSMRFPRAELMLNLFVIANIKNIRLLDHFPKTFEELWKMLYEDEQYLRDTLACVTPLNQSGWGINKEAVEHIFEFLQLEINYAEPKSVTPYYSKFLNLQTHNKKMFQFVKGVISRRKSK